MEGRPARRKMLPFWSPPCGVLLPTVQPAQRGCECTPLVGVGEGLEYSETGFMVLGRVIERACSCNYYDFIRENFIEPLELDHTLPADGPFIQDMAVGYMGDTEGAPHLALMPERTLRDGRLVPNPAFEFTGGGVIST